MKNTTKIQVYIPNDLFEKLATLKIEYDGSKYIKSSWSEYLVNILASHVKKE